MGDVIRFKESGSGEPHYSGWMACSCCGYVAMHVWPKKTPAHDLECSECHEVGGLHGVWNHGALALDDRHEQSSAALLVPESVEVEGEVKVYPTFGAFCKALQDELGWHENSQDIEA